MGIFKTLVVGAAIGALLAVLGLAALANALDPTATEVANRTTTEQQEPPAFYGER
ncbi:hypothetical protein WEI85_26090 [Actinomycetes bacterium KLBMP 9797]